MKKHLHPLAAATFIALLAVSQAKAGLSADLALPQVQPSIVTPGDTFSFDISGFNSAGTTGYLLTPDETATFGATTTYPAAGTNGQDITITSSEAVGATTTTDTFVVTTPTSFLTTTTVNGTTITQLQFDLGNANSGSNTVSLLTPITSATGASTFTYSGGTQAGTANITLATGGTAYSGVTGVNAGTSAISGFAVRGFSIAVTYANAVPEPSTLALGGLGLLGGAIGLVRRRRARAAV